MKVLAIDIGSSSVKAGVMREGRVIGKIQRVGFKTSFDGVRAEIEPKALLRAISSAIEKLRTQSIDLIALATLSPSWVAMDERGKPLTPIITHQDRRSLAVANELEKRIGKSRHLKLTGNRPFPGGISSTTCAWFVQNQPALMRRADLVGHLTTFLHRQLTGSRVIDPSHASFMGLYRTLEMDGWSEELCDAVGISTHSLPQLLGSEEIGGLLTRQGGRLLGLKHGTPMLAGITDTGAATLLAGDRAGQLVNVAGSTDVLALCTDQPAPHERLLMRALGVGRKWLSVSTLAAAGVTLRWTREQLFADYSRERFNRLLKKLGTPTNSVSFEPYLGGDRTSIDQPAGAFTGLTITTTREDMLRAVIDALARSSAERLKLLMSVNPIKVRRRVLYSGGTGELLESILHRDWPGLWQFDQQPEATLRGLWKLVSVPGVRPHRGARR